MKFSTKQYAQALRDAISDTDPKDLGKVLENFVAVLAENNDIRKFDEIASEFHKLEVTDKGLKLAEVTSAHQLSKQQEHEIIEQLNTIVGSKVELKKQVDDRLIGGLVIRVDDSLIDASVKNSLE